MREGTSDGFSRGARNSGCLDRRPEPGRLGHSPGLVEASLAGENRSSGDCSELDAIGLGAAPARRTGDALNLGLELGRQPERERNLGRDEQRANQRPMMSSRNAGFLPSNLWPRNWIAQPPTNRVLEAAAQTGRGIAAIAVPAAQVAPSAAVITRP